MNTRVIDSLANDTQTTSINGRVEKSSSVASSLGRKKAIIKDYTTTVTILESLRDAIFLLDAKGKIQYANQTALSLLHIDMKGIRDKYIDEIIVENEHEIPKRNYGNWNAKLLRQLKEGIQGNIEAYLHYSGEIVPVLLDFSIVSDHDGCPQFIIVSAKDFTKRKMMEKMRQQLQAKSIAHDRLRALGELSVGLVHELSQPLASLRLKVELFQNDINRGSYNKESLVVKSREMLGLIYRMSETIQNMRSFAHQTEDNTVGIVNIHEIVQKATTLVAHDLDSRDIQLEVEGTRSLPYVIANPLLIEQVIVNLLTNCRDAFDSFEEDGKKPTNGHKYIRIVTTTAYKKWVEIIVIDNAGGMSSQVMKRIFEPFFTTKEPGTNSGLGLTISKNIITSLGGKITASNVGYGTRMKIRIPLNRYDSNDQSCGSIEMLPYTR